MMHLAMESLRFREVLTKSSWFMPITLHTTNIIGRWFLLLKANLIGLASPAYISGVMPESYIVNCT